jgi:hypothetical protein
VNDDVEAALVQAFLDEVLVFFDGEEFAVAAEEATVVIAERLQQTKRGEFGGGEGSAHVEMFGKAVIYTTIANLGKKGVHKVEDSSVGMVPRRALCRFVPSLV